MTDIHYVPGGGDIRGYTPHASSQGTSSMQPVRPLEQLDPARDVKIEVACHESYEWEMRQVLAATPQDIEYLRGKGFPVAAC
ncbi:hypothetical protein MGYG_00903 [Nannizzia gypsea CBS 118893]|uniref:Uncharacterized protein n=1 Tax=Arthroderma gypseum (strain ATCC MYA-4604 / CBS 118893) TaxID=535722 RepID=E5R2U4_ARTGP|nr:hypothetical protein MGYG_00903 [Nannizzia gypsea CBS 118893]EFQ97865.1 hypothetical protein MGYG_00903 [Nannizzia gypsea CBS 118893]